MPSSTNETPATAAAPITRAHTALDRRALTLALAAGPVAALMSASLYAATGALSSFEGPLLPDVIAALFAGLAVTLVHAFAVASIARTSSDVERSERAVAIVVWCGSVGSAVGAALPVALWAL